MKTPFNPPRKPLLPVAGNGAARRAETLIEQFPTPAAPTVAMIVIGVFIFAASGAMYFLAGSRELPPSAEPGQASASVIRGEETAGAASDAGAAGAGDTVERPLAANFPLPNIDEPASVPAGMIQSAIRETAGGRAGTGFQAGRLSEADRASVLAPSPTADAGASTVPVAETVEEVLALEAIQRREVEADLAETSGETTAAIEPDANPKVTATATTWVNLRDGPSDDAQVLMVVPGAAEIQAETGCNWCAVTYDGRDGYIYKNFIDYD